MFHDVSLVFWEIREIREILYLSFFSPEPFCWTRLETTFVAAFVARMDLCPYLTKLDLRRTSGVRLKNLENPRNGKWGRFQLPILNEELKKPESSKSLGSQSFPNRNFSKLLFWLFPHGPVDVLFRSFGKNSLWKSFSMMIGFLCWQSTLLDSQFDWVWEASLDWLPQIPWA